MDKVGGLYELREGLRGYYGSLYDLPNSTSAAKVTAASMAAIVKDVRMMMKIIFVNYRGKCASYIAFCFL